MSPEKAERQEVLEITQGHLHIGKELSDLQQLLKDWFFTCLVIGTSFFYGVQVMLLMGLQWYWEIQREQRQREQVNLEDDASDNLVFEEMTENGNRDSEIGNESTEEPPQSDNDQSPVEVPIDDDNSGIDYGNDPGFFECDGAFDDGHEGEWEDLPQESENSMPQSNSVERVPADDHLD